MRSTNFLISFVLVFVLSLSVKAQDYIPLYSNGVPNSKQSETKEEFTSGMYRGVTVPTLEAFIPEKEIATGAAVIVVPGGGYSVVVYQGEGISNARQLAKNGIAAFVLKYRIPNDATMEDKSIGEVISVGTGVGATVGEIAEMILNILSSDKKIVEDSQRVRPEKSEVFKLICDNRKAKELLNWSPQYTLEEGLRETISFIQKNINSYEADKYTV